MSLRSYLFSLIGGLIVLLTISQLVLVNWIEQNLAKEVDVKARFLSEQVIELALEEFDQSNLTTKVIRHKVVKDSDKPEQAFESAAQLSKLITELQPKIEIIGSKIVQASAIANTVTSDKAQTPTEQTTAQETLTETAAKAKNDLHPNIRIIETSQVARHKFKKELKTLVDKIHHDNSAKNTASNDVRVFVRSPEIIREQWLEQAPPRSAGKSKQLINNIQWVLVICCFIALILAYWLSGQFNKPLKSLSLGFRKLAQGDYQHHVDESGVKEIRETIRHFNATVNHLSELTLAAKHHSEIAHLAELGEVSRGLAHALRNPIHTIGLSIEQLSDDDLTESQRVLLIKTVQNKINHIDKNIKALLTLTTTGVQRRDAVPVLAVIQDILLEYKSCQNRPQTFTTDVDPGLELIGAESEIRSIFHTLIINACEANPVNGHVNINANIDTDGVMSVMVTDQGQGLDPLIKNKLFQPHISTKPEGAGMGIYIANRLISLHYRGEIVLKNISPHGCQASATFNTKEVQ